MGKKVFIFAKEKPGLNSAIDVVKSYTDDVTVFRGELGDSFPPNAYGQYPDLTISYLSPWIIPKKLLDETKQWAINYHSGPPDYPGVGCTNFAVYNKEKLFGVTAHIMEASVDTGRIIGVKRFEILETDSVYSLTQKCYENIFELFTETIDYIFQHDELPDCEEQWQRQPYTRKQLEGLCRIEVNMEPGEIEKRISATTYPGMPGAYIELSGHKFEYNPNR